jgi:DNA-binding NarL/FixJ family response regulator
MGTSVRRTLLSDSPVRPPLRAGGSNGTHASSREAVDSSRNSAGNSRAPANGHAAATLAEPAPKIRVLLTAENRLLREALARMFSKQSTIEVVGLDANSILEPDASTQLEADVVLLSSRGSIDSDLSAIQHARTCFPQAGILTIGMSATPGEFLQCVRAGIRGYLLRDAASEEVLDAVRAVHSGAAVCPGSLCVALFRYFEQEAAAVPCGSARQRLGLTRREQQLIPLLAQGLTNKEIANHFSLSEQTVKNHVYRMKHKVGAHDRLDIVQLYRTHTFLV